MMQSGTRNDRVEMTKHECRRATLRFRCTGFRDFSRSSHVDTLTRLCLHQRVKWVGLLALVVTIAAVNSCNTLVTRRDLYSPEPALDSGERARQMATTTTTTRGE